MATARKSRNGFPMPNTRVVVAMSGGVDSSVAAFILKERGLDVIGVTIKTWSSNECRDERSKGCCSIRDIDDARAVARQIGIPYYVMDLSTDFKEKVIDYFVDEYLGGRTPNPCIECNRHIKFGLLLKKADELEAGFVATGHYARIGFDERERRYFIREGVDASKDQSYVLFGQTQGQLARALLPVGDLEKPAVRAMAERLGLRVFDKPDSQEICFVKKSYGDFLKQYAPEKIPGQGAFVTPDGEVVGQHDGHHLYTVGQRKRVRITNPDPYFVTGVNAGTNQVTLGSEQDLYKEEMFVSRVNWFLNPRTGPVDVKIRYKHVKTPGEIIEINGSDARLKFKFPQKAITPGQAAVFYDGDRVLGGGWIE